MANASQSPVTPPMDPRNPSSPYFLHPEEDPTQVLVPQPLTGENYHSWSRSMKRALVIKNKFKFVDGSITMPATTDPLHGVWNRCNAMVLLWIMNTLSPSIARSIYMMDNACEAWNRLKDRYSVGDNFRVAELLQKIHTIKQGDRTVSQYYCELRGLWVELEYHRPIPECTCACTCGALKTLKSYREMDYVISFLRGLNESFAAVKFQVMITEPLPSINKVYSLMVMQETLNNTVNNGRGKESQGRGQSAGATRLCTFCGKIGHTADTCYRKHGFPPCYKSTHSTSHN